MTRHPAPQRKGEPRSGITEEARTSLPTATRSWKVLAFIFLLESWKSTNHRIMNHRGRRYLQGHSYPRAQIPPYMDVLFLPALLALA